MLAVGAFYARSNRAFNDTLALLPEETGSGTRREKAIGSLADAWRVTSTGAPLSMLARLSGRAGSDAGPGEPYRSCCW